MYCITLAISKYPIVVPQDVTPSIPFPSTSMVAFVQQDIDIELIEAQSFENRAPSTSYTVPCRRANSLT